MYKMLIFDLDGTAIPNTSEGMPSENLVHTVHKLQEKGLKVCAATGRPLFNSKAILQKLGLHDPCIISGGTQVIDPITEEILWEMNMSEMQVEEIMNVVSMYPYNVFFSDDETSTLAKDKSIKGSERIIYIENISKDDTLIMLAKLTEIGNITAHSVISWMPDHFDIHITHAEATKSHALEMLLKMLHIHKNEVVAAGDSNNDLPLFEAAGYKIAMENGSDEVRARADTIALSAVDDGLAIALTHLFSLT